MKKIVYVTGNKYAHMIDECINLDKKVYESKYVGKKDLYITAYAKRAENFIFAIDAESGKLAGYLLTTPINKATYNKMRTGKHIDTKLIESKDIEELSLVKENHLYIYSLVVSPEYQGLGISKKLFEKLFGEIDIIANNYKTSVLADAINPKVFGNIFKYGFVPVGVSNHQSVIIEKKYTNTISEEMVV